jgi:branched-chain amino acid aminotransferase
MTQTVSGLEFKQQLSDHAKSAQERAAVLADPGFGNHFTDHTAVVDYSVDADGHGSWKNARIEPYGPIQLDPAAAVLHYGQEIFEGLKAYRHADGSVWTFRPEANAARLNRSAARLALPQLPEQVFLEAVRELVNVDKDWVPDGDGESLYLRPFMIATTPAPGRAAQEPPSAAAIMLPPWHPSWKRKPMAASRCCSWIRITTMPWRNLAA